MRSPASTFILFQALDTRSQRELPPRSSRSLRETPRSLLDAGLGRAG